MGVILIRKIPALANLSPSDIDEPGVFQKLKSKIKHSGTIKPFSGELLLQKVLTKIRILTLRTENKTGNWLGKLRQRSLKKKKTFSGDYWKKLKRRK